ncbi:MAG: hypothetical protein WA989_05765 [Henriciella sp.]|uniref:hypothetical protein n=1 Tax=Henriciella sp. TaxID=1968823 RepID=UPI003C74C333
MKNRNAFLLLAVAILQWIAPRLPALGLGKTQGFRATADGIPPELPPGIFFSIWGVIFLAYTGFALLAVFRPSYLTERLTGPLIIAGAGNVAWMVCAQLLGNDWLNALILLPILIFSWEASHRLHRMGGWDGTGERFLAGLVSGLLSGWLVVALSISLPELVRDIRGLGVSDQVWVSLWITLITAGLLAWVYRTQVSRGWWFYVALAWGLSGVVLNNWTRLDLHWLAFIAACAGAYIIGSRIASGARPSFE